MNKIYYIFLIYLCALNSKKKKKYSKWNTAIVHSFKTVLKFLCNLFKYTFIFHQEKPTKYDLITNTAYTKTSIHNTFPYKITPHNHPSLEIIVLQTLNYISARENKFATNS